MRRLTTTIAGLAIALSGAFGASPAAAEDPGICVGKVCFCVWVGGCGSPTPTGDYCFDVDLDHDGDWETVCVPAGTTR